jgi:hypothetical protein
MRSSGENVSSYRDILTIVDSSLKKKKKKKLSNYPNFLSITNSLNIFLNITSSNSNKVKSLSFLANN